MKNLIVVMVALMFSFHCFAGGVKGTGDLVELTSYPEAAKVIVIGDEGGFYFEGYTPIQTYFFHEQDYTVIFSKEGYKTSAARVTSSYTGWNLVDVFIVIPVTIVLILGLVAVGGLSGSDCNGLGNGCNGGSWSDDEEGILTSKEELKSSEYVYNENYFYSGETIWLLTSTIDQTNIHVKLEELEP